MKSPRILLCALAMGVSALATSPNLCAAEATFDAKAKAAQIDALVRSDLSKNKLKANARCTDEVFVRRVYLDVIGRVPTRTECLQFLQSTDTDKRSKLIDTLMSSEGYVQNFQNFWADVLRIQSTPVGGSQSLASGVAYSKWLRDSLTANKPYDAMVREMLVSTGTTYENGAVGFYIRDYNMPLDNMAVTTQVFLGTSMVCAQCHDHPFDKWSQLDYYQMAAHTYGMTSTNSLDNTEFYKAVSAAPGVTKKGKKVKAKATEKVDPKIAKQVEGYVRADLTRAMSEILRPLRYNHVHAMDKSLRLPHDYQYSNGKPNQRIEPTIPAAFSKDGTVAKTGENPSIGYAQWMTSKSNPRFTLVIANRLWRKFMGIGLIEPVDEITDSTVPSNPALMSMLEQTMKDLNYDMKAYMTMVLNSETYQAEAYGKDIDPGEPYHFPGPLMRRMSAEQIWDSMVALYKPSSDHPSRLLTLQSDSTLRRVEWLDRALDALTTEELIEGAKKIADVQKKLASDVRKAQEQMNEAAKSKDEEAIREAKKVVAQQRRKIDEEAEDIVYTMGWKKFAELARAGKLKEQVEGATFAAEIQSVLKKKNGSDLTIDEALASYEKALRSRAAESRKAADKALAEKLRVDSKTERKQFELYEQMRDTTVVRAAELRSPASNGHFLREFGQSDRELVDNASEEAAVGQALMMLNGRHFKTIMNPYTVIRRALMNAQDVNAAIDTIYLSTLSRHASEQEKTVLSEVIHDHKSDVELGNALWAVINTRQFLFIQ